MSHYLTHWRPCRHCGASIERAAARGRPRVYCTDACRDAAGTAHMAVRGPDEGPDVPLDGLTDVERYMRRAARILRAYQDGVEAAVINDEFGDKALENARRALKRGAA